MTDNWYDRMAKAMAKRATAVAGVQRWQEKVAEAEAEIEALTAAREAPAPVPPVLTDVTVAATAGGEAGASDDGPLLDASGQPAKFPFVLG